MATFVVDVYHAAISAGTSLAAVTASTASLLPTGADGNTARVCLFQCNNATGAHIRLGLTTTSTTATTSDLMVFAGQPPIALITRGSGAFAVIRDNAAVPCTVNVTPCEDA